ncbi:anti-sigma factor [Microbacterium sulfonylureivorans]|uniref:anti-sigma factor n=1 Tax=Microbacterium sulfonylureivorans TaxID=2486854 RepID=UPI000FDB04CB|nr:anti-sigma factor [Microbacterium sulfonylureivorans]
MSHLDPERLSLIAIGDPATAEERAHLEQCDECSLELAELEYTVAVGRSTVALGGVEAPPDRVWDRIADELRLSPSSGTHTAADPGSLGAVRSVHSAPARRGRVSRVLFALAASVALIVAGFGTWMLVRPADPVEVASASLDAFPDHPGAHGEAVVVQAADGERQVRVELDGSETDAGFREVWLINADASALVSLGVLDGSEGVFAIPDDVDLADYVLVDISQEPEDGDPAHSGDSIVRGELGFA